MHHTDRTIMTSNHGLTMSNEFQDDNVSDGVPVFERGFINYLDSPYILGTCLLWRGSGETSEGMNSRSTPEYIRMHTFPGPAAVIRRHKYHFILHPDDDRLMLGSVIIESWSYSWLQKFWPEHKAGV